MAMFWTDQISFSYFVEGQLRIIPVKFGQNWPSSIGGVVIYCKLLMTDDDH